MHVIYSETYRKSIHFTTVCNTSVIPQQLETQTNESPKGLNILPVAQMSFPIQQIIRVFKGLCLQRLEGPSVPIEFSQYLGCSHWTKRPVVLTRSLVFHILIFSNKENAYLYLLPILSQHSRRISATIQPYMQPKFKLLHT